MARGKKATAAAGGEGKPLTLTEVSKRIGISMPTLQKYKKRYGDRIPSVGKGRTQRYPAAALPVFAELRKENMARRGRPRKDGSAASPRKGARRTASRRGRPRKAVGVAGLLTLTEIQRRTKISYPTLLRYVKTQLGRIPHVGAGRARRFRAEAVEVFEKLRGESRRGRPPGSKNKRGGARRGRPPAAGGFVSSQVAKLAGLMTDLSKRLERVEKELKKPLQLVRR